MSPRKAPNLVVLPDWPYKSSRTLGPFLNIEHSPVLILFLIIWVLTSVLRLYWVFCSGMNCFYSEDKGYRETLENILIWEVLAIFKNSYFPHMWKFSDIGLTHSYIYPHSTATLHPQKFIHISTNICTSPMTDTPLTMLSVQSWKASFY